MNLILVIFFILIGFAGLVFHNNVGVFVGFALFPFQFSKMRKSEKANNIVLGVAAVLGSVYFIWTKEWLLLGLFLLSQVLTYNASQHLMKTEENIEGDEVEESKNT
ncbi:MAG: hypothetical protein ACLFPF_08760 [Halanaerobiales bacterium]